MSEHNHLQNHLSETQPSETETTSKKSSSRKAVACKGTSDEKKALMNVFRDNFLFALENRPIGRPLKSADVARKMNLSKSVISSWTKPSNLPSVMQLVTLSKILGRDVKWMLDKHTFDSAQDTTLSTYTDIFNVLLLLIDLQVIDRSGVKDYFLKYMVTRYDEVSRLKQVPEKSKDSWFVKVYSAFDVPMLPQLHPLMYTALEEEYKQFDYDTTVLKILELVRDYWDGKNKKKLDAFFDFWLEQNHPEEKELLEIERAITQ